MRKVRSYCFQIFSTLDWSTILESSLLNSDKRISALTLRVLYLLFEGLEFGTAGAYGYARVFANAVTKYPLPVLQSNRNIEWLDKQYTRRISPLRVVSEASSDTGSNNVDIDQSFLTWARNRLLRIGERCVSAKECRDYNFLRQFFRH